MSLHLKIVTPEKEIYNSQVDGFNAPSTDGELGILPNHANLMTQLIPGELKIKKSGKTEILAVGGGLLQISDNQAILMTDLAKSSDEIDEKATEEARKRAQLALEQKLSVEEYAETLAILEKSLVQLRVKRRHKAR